MANEPELIDGIYQWRSTIATGNQTQVGEVLEQGTGRSLAMKLVIEGKTETKEAKASIKAEAAIAKQFQHPNIVLFDKFSSSRDATYIVMEFFRAANVKAQLKSELPSLHSRAQSLMESVCKALAYLHEKGWVHRDLKPENVLLNRSGEAKLIDFSLSTRYATGIARMLNFKRIKTIQGTRTYIAPETIMRRPATPQTDIYSLGVMFFEVLTGKTPFQGFTPQELLQKHLTTPPPLPSTVNPNLSADADEFLLALLRKKPRDRPDTVNDILLEVRRIQFFKQDPLLLKAEYEEQQHSEKMSISAKIDSRTDHARSEMIRANPGLKEQFDAERRAQQERKKSKRRLPMETAPKEKAAAPPPPPTAPPPPPLMMPQPMMPAPMLPTGMHPLMMPQPMMPQPMMSAPMLPPVAMPAPNMPPGFTTAISPPPAAPPMIPGRPNVPTSATPPGAAPVPPASSPPVRAPGVPAARPPVPPPSSAPPAAASPPTGGSVPPDEPTEFMTELPNVL